MKISTFVFASLIVASSSMALVHAGPNDAEMGGAIFMGEHSGPEGSRMLERVARFHQRHMEKLKKDLKLEPTQQAAWDTFMEKNKPTPPVKEMKAELDKLSAPERMKKLQEMGNARFNAHYEAVSGFYAVLSPEQKKTFDSQFGAGMGMGHPNWMMKGHKKSDRADKHGH